MSRSSRKYMRNTSPKWIIGGVASLIVALGIVFAFLEKTVDFVRAPKVLAGEIERVGEKVDQHDQNIAQIQEYINAYESTQELIKQAPPGWRWDEKEAKYVPERVEKRGR